MLPYLLNYTFNEIYIYSYFMFILIKGRNGKDSIENFEIQNCNIDNRCLVYIVQNEINSTERYKIARCTSITISKVDPPRYNCKTQNK